MKIKIRGREYEVNSQTCKEDKTTYLITGKRGNRWYTMRNVNNPNLLFLMPEKGYGKTMEGVWLTDENGILKEI